MDFYAVLSYAVAYLTLLFRLIFFCIYATSINTAKVNCIIVTLIVVNCSTILKLNCSSIISIWALIPIVQVETETEHKFPSIALRRSVKEFSKAHLCTDALVLRG